MKFARCCLILAVALAMAPAVESLSQEVDTSLEEEPGKSEKRKPAEDVVELTVRPSAPARAALEHRLLPSYLEKTAGNAAPLYAKACLACNLGEEVTEKVSEWIETPVAELPRQEVRDLLSRYESVLRQLELASRRNHCDWELPIWEVDNPYEIILPELQESRQLARLVALKARLEIAEGRFDGAIHWLAIGFGLARDVADQPTLVGGLVGMAIAGIMLDQVAALIELPDAPNLYWSLTALPPPLVDLGDALEMESTAMYLMLPLFAEAKTAKYKPGQWEALFDADELVATFASLLPADETDLPTKRKLLADRFEKGHPVAKRELAARGYSKEEVDRMPASQAVVLYTSLRYDELRDAMFKWFHVPYWQADESIRRAQREIEQSAESEPLPLASVLLPAVANCQVAMTRTERRLAVLRTVEAIRLHAAAHDGKLPESLDEIKEVPVPVNPFTGQAFPYRVEGDTAVLTAGGPKQSRPREYRITLAD